MVVKITRTLLEVYFYKKRQFLGASRGAVCSAELVLGGKGAPAKAQPYHVPWRHWTVSPRVARGTRGVDVPKTDLDQLEDHVGRQRVLHDKKQHYHHGLHLEPSDPRRGNGQGEQQPCPNGHHPGRGC